MSKKKKYYVTGAVYHNTRCVVMAESEADALEKAKEIEASEATYYDGSKVNCNLDIGGPEFWWQDASTRLVKIRIEKQETPHE